MRALLRRLRAHLPRRYAAGGAITPDPGGDCDRVLAFVSSGRSTTIRPGETIHEAMDRLMEGEDL